MAYLYERITDGTLSLQAMTTRALKQICSETDDNRVRDMIGTILMYERSYVRDGVRRYKQGGAE